MGDSPEEKTIRLDPIRYNQVMRRAGISELEIRLMVGL